MRIDLKRLQVDVSALKYRVTSEEAENIEFNSSTLESAGNHLGDKLIVKGSTAGTIGVGQLVFLNSSTVWTLAAGNDTGVGENEILGMAITTTPNSDGVLTKGIFKLNTSYINGSSFTVGAQVFMHPSTAGSYTSTIPATAGQIARVVGYAIAADIIFFNPSPDYIEI